jgi:hydrogenase large subunit
VADAAVAVAAVVGVGAQEVDTVSLQPNTFRFLTMPTVITIDPVTRLEGHLRVDVTADAVSGKPQVVDARVSGTSFRGFEQMLVNRDPLEAPQLTQRICGVCPIPHGMAAVLALDKAANQSTPDNARQLRHLVMAANFIQSHLLHFYHLSLLDFVSGPAMPPWQPDWNVDRRVNAADTTRLIEHYQAALKTIRQAQEMGAVFAGRMPHAPAYIAGGFTTVPTAAQISQFRKHGTDLVQFIRNTYLPDVEFVVSKYPDYSQLGRGYGNLLAFGAFALDAAGQKPFFRGGRIVNGGEEVQSLNVDAITEQVACSWYDNASTNLHPANGATQPTYPKDTAYSWVKAPRYEREPYETGPLARMWINGFYRQGVSVNDRHRARAQETLKLAEAMPGWLDELKMGEPVYRTYNTPDTATSMGLTEAPRGALGHWLRIANRKIAHYQVITPTCWNASPRDDAHKLGPLEKALLGTPVQDTVRPVEVLRVIHSFDPCLACAVHVSRPADPSAVTVFKA